MGKILITLTDETERKLRLAAEEKLSGKKGKLSLAVEDAIKLWLKKK